MKAYKLFRVLKNGDIAPLFIDKNRVLKLGVWMPSENHPTKGFKERQGWHCTAEPKAPHLKLELKNGTKRVWYQVEIADYTEVKRPKTQGGLWYLAHNIKIIKKV